MTERQRKDIEVCEYFIPAQYRSIPISDSDCQRFLDSSERGTEKWNPYNGVVGGFDVLSLGKSRRGLHIELWEEGVLEGTTPYFTLLGGEDKPIPYSIVEYMKREMFKGMDAEIIENCYRGIV